MILLTGRNNVVRTITTLIAAQQSPYQAKISSWPDLFRPYRRFLNSRRRVKCDEHLSQPTIAESAEKISLLKAQFSGNDALDDLNQGKVIDENQLIDHQKVASAISEARVWLEENSKDHFDLFNLAITDLLVANSGRARAGSTSEIPGCIWIGDISRYVDWEVAEVLVHELVHNLVFLDELQHRHYEYKLISDKENYAVSSILGVSRPVDKVFHSVIVATEILLLRNSRSAIKSEHKVHPPTLLLSKKLSESIVDLDRVISRCPSILKPRALFLFELCKSALVTAHPNATRQLQCITT